MSSADLPADRPPENGWLEKAAPPAAPPVSADLTSGSMSIWTSFPADTEEGRCRVMSCLGEPSLRTEKVLGQDMQLSGVFAHVVEIEDTETGEMAEKVRTVLVLAGGETVAFVSSGILRSLKALVALWGRGPWEPPLNVRLLQVPTKRGFRTYNLEVRPRASKPTTKGGK